MARISSSTLFNFTNTLEHLQDNLKNGIYCHPTYEKLPIRNCGYVVHMACFCDIPLSLISEHFQWYGRFGLGLKRTYARKVGVTPIWYVTSESNLVKKLSTNELEDYEVSHLLPYLKQFMGSQELNGEIKRKKFYDEREWRYIPSKSLAVPYINKAPPKVRATSKKLRMPIDPEQIEYIILDKVADVKLILPFLKRLSTKHNVEYESLVSKIMTSGQIERDF